MATIISFPINTMIQQYSSQQKNTAREMQTIPRRDWSEKSVAGRTYSVSSDIVNVSATARVQVMEQEMNTAAKVTGLYEISINAAKNISDSLSELRKFISGLLPHEAHNRNIQIAETLKATRAKIENIVAESEFDSISLIAGNSEEFIEPFDMLYAAGSDTFIFKTYNLTSEGLGLEKFTYDLEHITFILEKAREKVSEAINQMRDKQDSIKKITKELLDRWEKLHGMEYGWIKNQSSHASQIANFLTTRLSKKFFKDEITAEDIFSLTSA